MSVPLSQMLYQHPTNPIEDTNQHTTTDKKWTHAYPSTYQLQVRTRTDASGSVIAEFDNALLGLYDDDQQRMSELAHPVNFRKWLLQSESDGMLWFHTEISNVVLAAWARFPLLTQVSEESPHATQTTKNADTVYSMDQNGSRQQLVIGEFKRGLIDRSSWQSGNLEESQYSLARELRGYAYLYDCPQIFCFDHQNFLMLQFRATQRAEIKSSKCPVDCWVIPRKNPGGTTLREALYRLLVQGMRRCQALTPATKTLHGVPVTREFFSGRPIAKVNGQLTYEPWGYTRWVDPASGAFYWVDAQGTPLVSQDGGRVWDTHRLW